ncbi:MAG: hypothetical protein GY862_25390 [Gammaproteobacteria bacterium]|nr:hypothetical protein [Gammaproteobacteria bacterium]
MSDSDRSALAVASGIRGNPPTQRDDGIYDDLEMTPRDKHLERLFLGAGARK